MDVKIKQENQTNVTMCCDVYQNCPTCLKINNMFMLLQARLKLLVPFSTKIFKMPPSPSQKNVTLTLQSFTFFLQIIFTKSS